MIEDIPKDLQIEMFHTMKRYCENIIKQIESDEMGWDNPKWGLEVELPDNKYHLVLELKEVEK